MMETRHFLLCFLAYGTLLLATNAQDCEFSNRLFKFKRIKTNVNTEEGCQSRCIQQQNCIVWQLLGKRKRCFLQVVVDKPNRKSKYGINNCKNGKPSENAPPCLVNKGYAKIIRKINRGASAKDCKSSCYEKSSCLIWQYNRRCEQYYLKEKKKKNALNGIGYCNDETLQTNFIQPSQTYLPGCRCGISNPSPSDSKIVGGKNVSHPHEYPWMAFVQTKVNATNYKNCGGTIISNKMILTANYCVRGYNETDITIGVGDTDYSKLRVYKISKNIPNPDNNPDTDKDDTALLLLETELDFDQETIAPICLPPSGSGVEFENKNGTALGWGDIATGGPGSIVLKEVNTTSMSNDICKNYDSIFPQVHFLTKDQMCTTGGLIDGTCDGDSGGPLMVLEKENFVQTGVLSFGNWRCNDDDSVQPVEVWIRTTETIDFIKDNWEGQTCSRSG